MDIIVLINGYNTSENIRAVASPAERLTIGE